MCVILEKKKKIQIFRIQIHNVSLKNKIKYGNPLII